MRPPRPRLSTGEREGAPTAPSRTPLQAAVRALARREFSRRELEQRLLGLYRGTGLEASVPEVLDRLEREGMLSDERMATAFSRSRASRLGRTRIAAEMQRKGLAPELIHASLPDPAAEAQAARQLWQRRFGELAPDLRARARQARFLAARGFPEALVRRIVNGRDFED